MLNDGSWNGRQIIRASYVQQVQVPTSTNPCYGVPQAILSADPGADLYYNERRILMHGVEDQRVPDPGPYQADSPNLNLDPMQYLNPNVLLDGLGLNAGAPPDCNVFYCAGTNPTTGPIDNLNAILGALTGVL